MVFSKRALDRFAALCLGVLLIVGCPAQGTERFDTERGLILPSDAISHPLGIGYDTIAKERRHVCSNITLAHGGTRSYNHSSIKIKTDNYDTYSVKNLTTSLGFTGKTYVFVASANYTHKSEFSSDIKRMTTNVVAESIVRFSPSDIANVTLKSKITIGQTEYNLQQIYKENPLLFRKFCGDHMVVSYVRGAYFIGTLGIETFSQDDHRKLTRTLDTELNLGASSTAKIDSYNSFRAYINNRRVDAVARSYGVIQGVQESVDGIINAYNTFNRNAEAIRSGRDDAFIDRNNVLFILTSPYEHVTGIKELSDLRKWDHSIISKRIFLEKMQEMQFEGSRTLADIRYASAHPCAFDYSTAQAKDDQETIERFLDEIKARIAACEIDNSQCSAELRHPVVSFNRNDIDSPGEAGSLFPISEVTDLGANCVQADLYGSRYYCTKCKIRQNISVPKHGPPNAIKFPAYCSNMPPESDVNIDVHADVMSMHDWYFRQGGIFEIQVFAEGVNAFSRIGSLSYGRAMDNPCCGNGWTDYGTTKSPGRISLPQKRVTNVQPNGNVGVNITTVHCQGSNCNAIVEVTVDTDKKTVPRELGLCTSR